MSRSAPDRRSPESALPLKPGDFQILMVLLEDDLHGYGIMQAVADESDRRVQLEVGSMYRMIARMTDQGLIADSTTHRDPADRRRYYRITPYGREVARLEAQRLVDVVKQARRHRLLDRAKS